MRGLMAVVLLGLACSDKAPPHDHSSAHPVGHDHHAEGHGHGDVDMVSLTLWSERFEVFAEHPVAVVGEKIPFLVHVTELDGFRAVKQGVLALELDGPEAVRGHAFQPVRPGIFELKMTLPVAGRYRGKFRLSGVNGGSVGGVEITVKAQDDDKKSSASHHHGHHHGGDQDHDEGVIEFLKEQQWGVPFGTTFAAEGTLTTSLEVPGVVATPPGGSAEVGVPVTGRLVAPTTGLLGPGSTVKKGQLLASLIASPASPEALARAQLIVAEATARAAAAASELARSERLHKDQALPLRDLEAAQREVKVAQEAVRAAERSAASFAAARQGRGKGAWQLTAPIDGILVSVGANPGATVSPGQTLFRIIDPRVLWIVARVPEGDAAALRRDRDASFRLPGQQVWQPITLSGDKTNAKLAHIARVVDPVTRSVEVVYALQEPGVELRVGGLVQVSVPAGEAFAGVVIERSALIDQDGRAVVYVQLDGEHFEERLVRLGPRSGGRIAILDGLRAGERIVTKGAQLVRLADGPKGEQPHGHIH